MSARNANRQECGIGIYPDGTYTLTGDDLDTSDTDARRMLAYIEWCLEDVPTVQRYLKEHGVATSRLPRKPYVLTEARRRALAVSGPKARSASVAAAAKRRAERDQGRIVR